MAVTFEDQYSFSDEDNYEPYYIRKERSQPNSEFSEDSMKDYMWNRWGIK